MVVKKNDNINIYNSETIMQTSCGDLFLYLYMKLQSSPFFLV